jgi:hypothetical protein
MHAVATSSRPDRVDGAEPEARSRAARLRVFAAVVVGPLVTGYAAVAAVLALVTAVASRSEFSAVGVLLAAGPGWLALHQVPLEIEGQPLGVLPLLPTIGAIALVARTCASAAQRLGYREPSQAVTLICLAAAAHGVFGAAVSMVSGGDLSTEPLASFLVPALLAGLAAGLGLARQCALSDGVRRYLDPAALLGLRAGAVGLAGLLAAGALTFVIATGLSAPTVHELFVDNAPGFGSGLGMLLLSLGYVPNAVIGALGFATGTGVDIGAVSLSPFGLNGGDVPGLPLLAGLPEEHASWWPVFLLLPAAVGVLVGWSLRQAADRPTARLRMVAIAGVLVGFAVVVLGTVSGGRVGGLPELVGISVAAASVAAFCWVVVPGGLVAWFAGPRPSATVETPAQDPGEPEESSIEWPAEETPEPGEDRAEEQDEEADPDADVSEAVDADTEDEAVDEQERGEGAGVTDETADENTAGAGTGSGDSDDRGEEQDREGQDDDRTAQDRLTAAEPGPQRRSVLADDEPGSSEDTASTDQQRAD